MKFTSYILQESDGEEIYSESSDFLLSETMGWAVAASGAITLTSILVSNKHATDKKYFHATVTDLNATGPSGAGGNLLAWLAKDIPVPKTTTLEFCDKPILLTSNDKLWVKLYDGNLDVNISSQEI